MSGIILVKDGIRTFLRRPEDETTLRGMVFPTRELGANAYSKGVPDLKMDF